jgi:hypothetical protein
MTEWDDLSLPPTDGTIWPPDVMTARARFGRSLAASAIVTGSCDPAALETYKRWLMVSVLLGDTDTDMAAASLVRAEQLFARNLDATKNPA